MKYVLVIVTCFSLSFLTACRHSVDGSVERIESNKDGGGGGC